MNIVHYVLEDPFVSLTRLTNKTDERILQDIMKNNIHCNNSNDTFKLIICYPSHTTTSLVLRNIPTPTPAPPR